LSRLGRCGHDVCCQVLRSYLGCGSRSQNDPTINANDRRLAAAAQLSQEQRQALCALRVPFYTNLGRLEAQRARLTAQLQVCQVLFCRAFVSKG